MFCGYFQQSAASASVYDLEPECDNIFSCPLPDAPASMVEYIRAGRDFLEDKRIKKHDTFEDILFCILKDDAIEIILGQRREQYFPLSKKTMEVVYSKVDGYLIERVGGGGKNTRYRIEKNGKTFPVLAVKRFERKNAIIYSPYSDDLYIDELIKEGSEYIDGLINGAFQELATLQVPSRTYPGRMVGEVQTERQKRIVKAILLNEQMDITSFFWGGDTGSLIERIFVIYGANKEHAYFNSTSDANAHGIAQFIPDTYQRVVDEYPQANLFQGFIAGTRDHANVVKAMVCLIDSELNELGSRVAQKFAEDPKAVEIYIPSFYNGGSSRTAALIRLLGDAWDKPLNTSSPIIGKAIMEETIYFLKKFKYIMRYLEYHP